MRNHRTITVRISDEQYRYLQARKATGTPIAEVVRQALAEHIEREHR
jgi:predicted DNA-binding protein